MYFRSLGLAALLAVFFMGTGCRSTRPDCASPSRAAEDVTVNYSQTQPELAKFGGGIVPLNHTKNRGLFAELRSAVAQVACSGSVNIVESATDISVVANSRDFRREHTLAGDAYEVEELGRTLRTFFEPYAQGRSVHVTVNGERH